MNHFQQYGYALGFAIKQTAVAMGDFAMGHALGSTLGWVAAPWMGEASPWLGLRAAARIGSDGIVFGGAPAAAGIKFASRKGLPQADEKTLFIENEPHTRMPKPTVVIKEGYGKGVKKVLWTGPAIVKSGARKQSGFVEYCFHEADKAGPHFDLVVGTDTGKILQLRPGASIEFNIPNGDFKGRYAIAQTPKGAVCTRMADRAVLLPKPAYQLKHEEFLAQVDASPEEYIVQTKADGSLGNATVLAGGQVVFRSHRDSASAYYDKLPGLESIRNTSPIALSRFFFPDPKLTGTVFQGELVHGRGASYTGGILNSAAPRARATQHHSGDVQYYIWDIQRYRGRDVSSWPYAKRWALCQALGREIARHNPNWHLVETAPPGKTAAFYRGVISRTGPLSEGVVVKQANDSSGRPWIKVKETDFFDLEVVGVTPGEGKHTGRLGTLTVKNPETGAITEVGTGFTDFEREWIFSHASQLQGSYAKVQGMELTENGIVRAPVFAGFHEGKGNTETALMLYSEAAAGPSGDPQEILYSLKSSAGWRRK